MYLIVYDCSMKNKITEDVENSVIESSYFFILSVEMLRAFQLRAFMCFHFYIFRFLKT